MATQVQRPNVRRATWRAMGSSVEVVLVGAGDEHLETVRRTVAHLESCWSRFVGTSDVSRLNRAQGMPVRVDPATIGLLETMAAGAVATEGAFDPTLLAPLVALGYAASWEDPASVTSLAAGSCLRSDVRAVLIDRDESVAQLPPGCVLDAGGVGKGLAADVAVEAVMAAVPDGGAMVSIGGDVRVSGTAPDGTGWVVAVANEPGGEAVAALHVADAGIATSGTMHRTWRAVDGTAAHHLIDPRSGAPTAAGPRAVTVATVVAGNAAWAEVWTKALVVDGAVGTLDRLDDLRLPGRVCLGDGSVIVNSSWSAITTDLPGRAS